MPLASSSNFQGPPKISWDPDQLIDRRMDPTIGLVSSLTISFFLGIDLSGAAALYAFKEKNHTTKHTTFNLKVQSHHLFKQSLPTHMTSFTLSTTIHF